MDSNQKILMPKLMESTAKFLKRLTSILNARLVLKLHPLLVLHSSASTVSEEDSLILLPS